MKVSRVPAGSDCAKVASFASLAPDVNEAGVMSIDSKSFSPSWSACAAAGQAARFAGTEPFQNSRAHTKGRPFACAALYRLMLPPLNAAPRLAYGPGPARAGDDQLTSPSAIRTATTMLRRFSMRTPVAGAGS